MRSTNQNRMTLSFKNDEQKKLFMGYIKNQASIDEVSPSEWAITTVLNEGGLSLDDSFVREFLMSLYNGTGTIASVLEYILNLNSDGEALNAAHANAKPLVEYFLRVSHKWNLKLNNKNRRTHHFLDCFDSIVNKVERNEDGASADILTLAEREEEVKYGRDLYSECKNTGNVPLSNIIAYVLRNWSILGNYTYTFRALASLVAAARGWKDIKVTGRGKFELVYDKDVSKLRNDLAATIREVCSEWHTS